MNDTEEGNAFLRFLRWREKMTIDELLFFNTRPQALPIYEAVAAKIDARYDIVNIRVQKTQITFSNAHNFAAVSTTFYKKKGWPDVYIVLSFGLFHRIDHPRIWASSEPYPNRWTHHVVIASVEEVDDVIMEWIAEAYDCAMSKGKRR